RLHCLVGLISCFKSFTSKESFGSVYLRITFFAFWILLTKEILGTSKLSHKFQVTIPKEVRDRFKLHAGDILVFTDDNGKLVFSKNVQP
ncbi:MAG: AbrB/MazE/SpoVT family DNA-binding domain-containing protein, partial [Rhabdochlamydiaceae bacterium]